MRGVGRQSLGGVLTSLLSSCPQEALPGLIWDLGQQLGDLSLESGGLEQESGRSSGEQGVAWDTPIFPPAPYLSSCFLVSSFPHPWLPHRGP